MSFSNKDIPIQDLMLTTDEFPVVEERFLLKETLEKMNYYKLLLTINVENLWD